MEPTTNEPKKVPATGEAAQKPEISTSAEKQYKVEDGSSDVELTDSIDSIPAELVDAATEYYRRHPLSDECSFCAYERNMYPVEKYYQSKMSGSRGRRRSTSRRSRRSRSRSRSTAGRRNRRR